jgi:hypothetical protein
LAAAINDWGELADHRSYVAQLRRDHGRKYGFWGEVPKQIIPEAEAEAKAAGKGVVKIGREGRRQLGVGATGADTESVQPGLW